MAHPDLRDFARSALGLFTSLRLAIGLFALFICTLIPSTISPQLASAFAIPIRIMGTVLFLVLALCTLRKLKTLRASILLVHLGSLVVIAGFLVSSFGFVATVNVYEGGTTGTAYRWDEMADKSLGFDLCVTKIHEEHYPVPVKVGVLKNGRQAALFVTRTGGSFAFEDYLVRVDSLDLAAGDLRLDVRSRSGQAVGTFADSGTNTLPPEVPLEFKLVAFKDPFLKRVWVDLELRENGRVIAAGTSEVNHPFAWQSMRFFNTQVARDPFGRPYAGIQIRRDPGIPFVYAGFSLLCLGCLLALARWSRTGRGGRT